MEPVEFGAVLFLFFKNTIQYFESSLNKKFQSKANA